MKEQAETYTPKQIEAADRLAKAIAIVPGEKRPAYIRTIEAMMLGAELAELGRAQAAPPGA